MTEFQVTVCHVFGATTETVNARNEIMARRKAITQHNKRLKYPFLDRKATGAYVSNKGTK